ncbi:MAG: dithiol-disulfide isomerase [Bacteroidota bacterium]|jgi:protein disulfide-isomerase
MKIEIWSDIMCPFCYIGKRHFEKALSEMNLADTAEIEWKSFQLDPTIPKILEKVNVYQYLADAKGISFAESKQMHDNVVQSAKNVGLIYKYDNAVVANSFDAHRMIQYAKTKELGNQIEEALFKAYFTEGKNIGDINDLLTIGVSVGINKSDLQIVLESEQFTLEVNNDISEAQKNGVRGVPFFVFDRKYAISGAQPISVFIETLEKVLEESKSR